MTTSTSILIHLLLVLAGSGAAAVAQSPAQPAAKPLVARLKATAANLDRVGGETITIDIRRWSTDEDRDKLLAAFSEKGAGQVAEVLQKMDSAGYIWRSGSGFGQFVRYAFQTKLPDGRQQIVVATDQDLSDWNRRSGPAPAKSESPFTLFEFRLPAKGPGEGKISLSAKIASDAATKTLALENYGAAPIALKGVTREQIGN